MAFLSRSMSSSASVYFSEGLQFLFGRLADVLDLDGSAFAGGFVLATECQFQDEALHF